MARGLNVDESEKVASQLAESVASANQWADQEPFNISAFPGTNHWQSHEQAREGIEKAIRTPSTLSFGYRLHAVQDYFTHFGQGFTAETGAQGMNRWKYVWAEDDRFSVTGIELEAVNAIPVELRELRAMDWGHVGATLLGLDPDAFDSEDLWDQIMVEETEYYLWEFLLYWFEYYGEDLLAEDASEE